MNTFDLGVQAMLYGMLGVFVVLILFFLITKFMVNFFSKHSKK